MTITLRTEKGSPLTYSELDENFNDLEDRLNSLEVSKVLSLNGKVGFVTITTADIPEGSNLYYTDARVDARIDNATTDNIDEGTTNKYFTESRARSSITSGSGISYNTSTGAISLGNISSTDVPEGTNLYFTNARVDSRVATTSITALNDVSSDTPAANHVLTWNAIAEQWQPAEAPGATGGEANTGTNLGTGQGIFAGKVGVDFKFYTLDGLNGISILAPTSNVITIANPQNLSTTATPTFANVNISNLRITDNTITTVTVNGNLTLSGNGIGRVVIDGSGLTATNIAAGNITISGNTITNSSTNGSIILTPNGAGAVLSTAAITSPQFISNIATGTAPFVVTSTTQVANLNVATAGTAATVTGASQPNITSLGVLTSVVTTGSISSNANINLGNINGSNTPFVDFHSSGNAIDYDARIIASGGNSVVGSGTLQFLAANINISNGLNVSNLRLEQNTISTTNSNGNMLLNTNGTGKVGINKTPTHQLDVNGTIGSNSLIISNSVVVGTSISDTFTINSSLVNSLFPSVSNNNDLGSATLKFKSGYFGSNVFVDGSVTTTLTNGSITLAPNGSGLVLLTGSARISTGATIANFRLDTNAGTEAYFGLTTGNVLRWQFGKAFGAEIGGNAGASFGIYRYADNGDYLGRPLFISRASGEIFVENALSVSGKITGSASTASLATLNIPHGTAPTVPVNGDIWTTTSGLYARINNTTYGLSEAANKAIALSILYGY